MGGTWEGRGTNHVVYLSYVWNVINFYVNLASPSYICISKFKKKRLMNVILCILYNYIMYFHHIYRWYLGGGGVLCIHFVYNTVIMLPACVGWILWSCKFVVLQQPEVHALLVNVA